MDIPMGEEQASVGEDEAIKGIVALQIGMMMKTNPTRRGQHQKHHGCVDAEFIVRNDIPEPYRVGLFKCAKTYKAKVRWSNGGTDDDRTPDIHGMAIKVLDVEGSAALNGLDRQEQDFVLIDNEVFFTRDPAVMLALMNARVAAATTSTALAEFEQHHPGTLARLAAAKKTIASPLATRYWSTVPYKLGDGAVKYVAVPSPDNSAADAEPPSADYLRRTLVAQLAEGKKPAQFEVCIIPQTTGDPVEDPTVLWQSAPVPVAIISVEPQSFDTPERMKECERTSFDPWHALAEHRPLGGINRARRAVYAASLKVRQDSAAV